MAVTWKLALALAIGCMAILKSCEMASVTCLKLANVCMKVSLSTKQRNAWVRIQGNSKIFLSMKGKLLMIY